LKKVLANGPCQPRTLNFPSTRIGNRNRRFNSEWFDEFGNWLEYSESTDRAYCFTCFLFRDPTKKEAGYKSFVLDGWNTWYNKESLAKLYPADFDHVELRDLNTELFLYIDDVRQDDRFANIHTIVELSQKNGTDKDTSYLSFGLSAFEISTCIACCHNYS